MENVVDALKIVFGFLMFGLALTLSISSFSQANIAVQSITTIRDRETDYTYVEPALDSSGNAITERIVGIETVIPTMYKAYKENFKIVFLQKDGKTAYPLYYKTNSLGNRLTPSVTINYVDLEEEVFANAEEAIKHLNILLNKRTGDSITNKYYNQFKYTEGLYKQLSKFKFKELLGEYYQEDAKEGKETEMLEVNKTKKRVITYVIMP